MSKGIRWNVSGYLIVLVVCSVVYTVGEIVRDNYCQIFGCEKVPNTPVPQLAEVQGAFGAWKRIEDRNLNDIQLAKTDGFVSVLTGGDRPATGVLIRIGTEPHNMGTVLSRTRSFDGVTCPIPKGYYWKIDPENDGSVTVYWMPVQLPNVGG